MGAPKEWVHILIAHFSYKKTKALRTHVTQ